MPDCTVMSPDDRIPEAVKLIGVIGILVFLTTLGLALTGEASLQEAFAPLIAFAIAIQAAVLFFQYWREVQSEQPRMFAYPSTPWREPRIRIENSGGGIAWNGTVTVRANKSGEETRYTFKRIHPRGVYKFPSSEQDEDVGLDSDVDEYLEVIIEYADDEGTEEPNLEWEGRVNLTDEPVELSEDQMVW